MEFNETMKINLEFDKEKEVREIVAKVYEALKIKGYDPISQIVGYHCQTVNIGVYNKSYIGLSTFH